MEVSIAELVDLLNDKNKNISCDKAIIKNIINSYVADWLKRYKIYNQSSLDPNLTYQFKIVYKAMINFDVEEAQKLYDTGKNDLLEAIEEDMDNGNDRAVYNFGQLSKIWRNEFENKIPVCYDLKKLRDTYLT